MADVAAKGFLVLESVRKHDTTTNTSYGGRVDIHKTVDDIKFVLSATDASVREYENAPHIKDLLITADKKISSTTSVGAGYDFGFKTPLATIEVNTHVANKATQGKLIWIQRHNTLRAEGALKLDSRSTLSGAYTYRHEHKALDHLMGTTYSNLKERTGFVIQPFVWPVSTQYVKYTLDSYNGWKLDAAFDVRSRAAYLSASTRRWGESDIRASYAVKEEVAMLEVVPKWHGVFDRLPVTVFARTPLGRGGVGPLSVGLIYDDVISL